MSSFYNVETEDDIVFTAYDVNIDSYLLFNAAIIKNILSIDSLYKAGNYDDYRVYMQQFDENKMKILKEIIFNNMKKYENIYDFSKNLKEPKLDDHIIYISSKKKDENIGWYYEYIYDGVTFIFRFHVDSVSLDSILNRNTIKEKMPFSECKRIFDHEGICGGHIGYNYNGEFYKISDVIKESIKQGFEKEIWLEKEKKWIWHHIDFDDALDNSEIYYLEGRREDKIACTYTDCDFYLRNYLEHKTKLNKWNFQTLPGDKDYISLDDDKENKITIMGKNKKNIYLIRDYLWDTSILYQIKRIVGEIDEETIRFNNEKELIIEKNNILKIRRYYKYYFFSLEEYIKALDLVIRKFEQEEERIDKYENFLFLSYQKIEKEIIIYPKTFILLDYPKYRDMMTNDIVVLNRQQREIQREIDGIQREIGETQREIDRQRSNERISREEQKYQEERKNAQISICLAIFLGGFSILMGILSIWISLKKIAIGDILFKFKYYKIRRKLRQIKEN